MEYRDGIKKLLEKGYIDARHANKCCSKCKQTCIRFELEHVLADNEVFVKHILLKTSIYWKSYCILCAAKYENERHCKRLATEALSKNLAHTIKRHINGYMDTIQETVNFIRKRDKGICRSCGVHVTAESKSGWKQESINDMLNNDDTSPIENLVTSCLACNLAQNSLSWEKHLYALTQIATPNKIIDVSPLSPQEYAWFARGHGAKDRACPVNVRLQLFARDGRYCRVTGKKMAFKSHCWNTASFDRINSKLPYTLENTRLVFKHINFVKKGEITESELQEWVAHVRKQFFYCYLRYIFFEQGLKTIIKKTLL